MVATHGRGRIEASLDTDSPGRRRYSCEPATTESSVVAAESTRSAPGTRRINAARLGVAAALVGPRGYFIALWYLNGGLTGGLFVTLFDGAFRGAPGHDSYATSHPIRALRFFLVVTFASRFAAGR